MKGRAQGGICKIRVFHCVALVAVALLLSMGSMAHAQVLYGSITGTVTDKTGAIVPNAAITLTNQDTGARRTGQSNGDGSYDLLDVLPGNYSVAAQVSGFAAYRVNDIHVEVNSRVRVDVTLQPGAVTTEVTVNGTQAAALQTESAEVNSQITQTELNALPSTSSAGRNFQALYTIIPGASAVQEKNSTSANPSRSMSVNVNGNSYNGNTTRIDGAVNYYGWLPYILAYVPPQDAIENVSFTTNAFNPEQGQAGGAAIKITTKSGTAHFHGSGWWYYGDAAINAKPYTTTPGVAVPKFVQDEWGFNIGGPVYIPHILTGKKKLFFFDNFERTTQRKHISGDVTIPTTPMLGGDFSQVTDVALPASAGSTILYDPQPMGVPQTGAGTANGYLLPGNRPTFLSEYGCNCIPASRQSYAASTMLALLQPLSSLVGTAGQPTANFAGQLANDYFGGATYAYNRETNDAKIDYVPNENSHIFGKYSIEPFSIIDPQELGDAGGSTFDGGQPGVTGGRIQNIGLGYSRIITSSLVLDADFGYTRQFAGAQSSLDLKDGDFGLNTLKIPGTNSTDGNTDYVGQPIFSMNSTFSTLGNAQTANPFKFRDNQFTGDVNLSWVKGHHSTKYGFTYYHFDLNHFQPNLGSGVSNPRGGFLFQGAMSSNSSKLNAYNALADFLLGLPNDGTGQGVSKAIQTIDPKTLRWSTYGAYAQDTWTVTPQLTIVYGIRYEYYPTPYMDHTGIYLVHPELPQTGNVEIGGVNGNPEGAGLKVGWGNFVPRIGFNYSLTPKTVVRTGFGMTTDPDSYRVLRDMYPGSVTSSYTGTAAGTIAVDPANNNAPMTLSYGIPGIPQPDLSTGFVPLPVAVSTQTVPLKYNRGYVMSWNLIVQRELPGHWVGNLGYVGTEYVRQPATVTPYNSAAFPTADSVCMPNGQFNPSSPYITGPPGSNPCSFAANETINIGAPCPPTTKASALGTCYNTGGINLNAPQFRSFYNAMQSQLTRQAGKNGAIGIVYTFSRAIDFEDNGAGSGSGGTAFNYPAYYHFNRGLAGYDVKHNAQVYAVYNLPFGYGQKWANHGASAWIAGGWQLNGQFSHQSGTPFSVVASSNSIGNVAPGWGTTFAQLVKPYHQMSGHSRVAGVGTPWFDPTSFANPTEPPASVAGNPDNASPTLPNTYRNEFRGPGVSDFNTSLFRSFHIWHEKEFQFRFEAFNVFNHALLYNFTNGTGNTGTPNNTVGGGTFGYVTAFGQPYSPSSGSRSLQFSGRINF
jgi:hypothetical protein